MFLKTNTAETMTFGLTKTKDAEGASDVTTSWQEHNANAPVSLPGPDFRAMNKLAVNGVLREFNKVTLKQGDHGSLARRPSLPSDKNPEHAYGRRCSQRLVEESRYTGIQKVGIKSIVEGQYIDDWITMNSERKSELEAKHEWRQPAMTKAASGHATATAKCTIPPKREPFKMSKFKKMGAKVHIPK